MNIKYISPSNFLVYEYIELPQKHMVCLQVSQQ